MTLASEIAEIPTRALECAKANKTVFVDLASPLIGMGSSYFAALTLQYCDRQIRAEIASEFDISFPDGNDAFATLISQSGASTETVWCLDHFDDVSVIVNNVDSPLGKASKAETVIEIHAGQEAFSSTKSYINTLVTLYQALGADCEQPALDLATNWRAFEDHAGLVAGDLAKTISAPETNGRYVIGSGVNLATAYQTALVLTETTKLPWIGMSVAQFDHGPKEAAANCTILALDANRNDSSRITHVARLVGQLPGVNFQRLVATERSAHLSPLSLFSQSALVMQNLAELFNVGEPFAVGAKVTTVDDATRS